MDGTVKVSHLTLSSTCIKFGLHLLVVICSYPYTGSDLFVQALCHGCA